MQLASVPEIFPEMHPVDANSADFLRQMAGLVPGVIYIFNHRTRSNEFLSKSVGQLFGYTPQELEDMGEQLIETCVHEDDAEGLADYFASIADLDDGITATLEYRDYTRDGSIVWLRSIDAVYERDDSGKVLRHIGIAFDITREKEAEARLRDMNRELEELTYIASHDLKVPVSNMSSLTRMLSEAQDLLPSEHAETLGWMREVCAQASEKLDALVCVAQANSGHMGEFGPVGLEEIYEKVMLNLHYQISDARAVVTTDFKVPEVHFLHRELENILQATLANAVRYRSPERRLRVLISARKTANAVEIAISDNGSGIDLPRDTDKVFGLFKRAHSAPDGAGVALYTIRRLMERFGGAIRADAIPGEGAVFTLTFPDAETGSK